MDPAGAFLLEATSYETNRSYWACYKDWARRNQSKLWFVDDAVSRLLFLTSSDSSRWRDIGWGLLELHRLILHRAIKKDNPGEEVLLYGTTVEITASSKNNNSPTMAIRFALTILQTLYPIVLEVLRSPGDSQRTMQRQTTLRRYLERARFVLRAVLLYRYWKSVQEHTSSRSVRVPPGLLVRGGMLVDDHESREIVTIQDEISRIERHNYIGKRTGRRYCVDPVVPPMDAMTLFRIKCSELLYILRPLLYAECGNSNNAFSVWAMALAMDLVSLWGLKDSGNTRSRQEWERRRMRLLLYALRAPVWNRYGVTTAERVGSSLQSVPLLGGLLRNYFWDWLSYWKDYRLEEG